MLCWNRNRPTCAIRACARRGIIATSSYVGSCIEKVHPGIIRQWLEEVIAVRQQMEWGQNHLCECLE